MRRRAVGSKAGQQHRQHSSWLIATHCRLGTTAQAGHTPAQAGWLCAHLGINSNPQIVVHLFYHGGRPRHHCTAAAAAAATCAAAGGSGCHPSLGAPASEGEAVPPKHHAGKLACRTSGGRRVRGQVAAGAEALRRVKVRQATGREPLPQWGAQCYDCSMPQLPVVWCAPTCGRQRGAGRRCRRGKAHIPPAVGARQAGRRSGCVGQALRQECHRTQDRSAATVAAH